MLLSSENTLTSGHEVQLVYVTCFGVVFGRLYSHFVYGEVMLIEAGRTQTNKIVCTNNNNNKVVRKNRCSSSLCVGAYLRFSLGAASAYIVIP